MHRLKARLIEAANGATSPPSVRQHLEMALDLARKGGAFLEELETCRVLRDYAAAHGDTAEAEKMGGYVLRMEEVITKEQ